jgi:branched-chain amino acid transport system substrate-binding protein
MRAISGVVVAMAAVAALAGCGSSSNTGSSATEVVDIYSSLPLTGASRTQSVPMVNGMELALAQAGGRAGRLRIHYVSLDDATAAAGKWDPAQTNANARTAVSDSRAIVYLGEFNSGASEISIPILNQAGIPQISPSNSYVGLTTNEPGSAPGEPQKYYPTGKRNYVRIEARDTVQAAVLLQTFQHDGCKRVAVANDKEAYGGGLAQLLEIQKQRFGVDVVSNTGIDPTAPNFRSYAATLAGSGVDCFMFAGIVSNGAVQITKDVNAALPHARIYGDDGVCTSAYTNAAMGGIPAAIDPKVQCTVQTLDLPRYPGGQTFLAAYKARFGVANPDPYAIYGYETMKLALDTIAGLGARGNDRSAVIAALFATKHRNSVLGTYGFDADGDTTLKAYGLYEVRGGNPAFERTVTPPS